jgi:hypothetical protein
MIRPIENTAPNRGKKGAARPNDCIFCGNGPPSLEHMLPGWTGKYLPAEEGKFVEWSGPIPTRNVDTGEIVKLPPVAHSDFQFERRYDVADLQLYGPCEDCNNGWMSRIEVEAEPVLAPILRDEPHTISVADQAILAKWATLRAIVSQLSYLDRAIYSPARCRQFMMQPGRFATSRIFIGRSSHRTGRNFFCSPYLMQDAAGIEPKVRVALYSVFQFGPLVIVVFYGAEPPNSTAPEVVDIVPFPPPEFGHLLRELPVTGAVPISWPLAHPIHPQSLHAIRHWFRMFLVEVGMWTESNPTASPQ